MHSDIAACKFTFKIDGLVAHRVDIVHLCWVDDYYLIAIVPTLTTYSIAVGTAGELLHRCSAYSRYHIANLPVRHAVQVLSKGGFLVRYYVECYPVPALLQLNGLYVAIAVLHDYRAYISTNDCVLLEAIVHTIVGFNTVDLA